jgi:DNA invertase Pin-like site-specific DNA recombinase
MNNRDVDPGGKIQAEHLALFAYVYVRQSSLMQVRDHQESGRRQYQLVDWLLAMGWPKQRIVIVDEDQGKSGLCPNSRSGFARLAAAIAAREVGIVLALEATRLARNSPDWNHLLYICRWTGTLIADEQAVYDPRLGGDRAMLGIRGHVSELEIEGSIERMVKARWSMAERGELLTLPPAGYDFDDLGQWILTTDEAVAHAIRTVFAKFDELGAARQVLIWWREKGLRFPVRRVQLRSHPVVWIEPDYRMIRETLRHPIYAGAYAFGKSKTVRELDPEDPTKLRVRRRILPLEKWRVLIQDHHEAYISFEKFLENRKRLQGNSNMSSASKEDEATPAREGPALLQGLVRCGHCGRSMSLSYGGHKSRNGKRIYQYRCMLARNRTGGEGCRHVVGGKRIDKAVVSVFLEATQPAALQAAHLANEQVRQEGETVKRYWQYEIEKAEYEAQRAGRQFNAVEPENRLVGRQLEERWNTRLADLEAMQGKAREALQESPLLTDSELEKLGLLAADLEAVWEAETTSNRDRKRLLRCLIEEVQLVSEDTQYQVRIAWKGGAVTERQVRRIKPGETQATAEDTIDLVRRLAEEFDDAQIARILSKQGRRTGLGNSFTKQKVLSLRGRHRIPKCPSKPARDPREGPFNADEAARELGVSMTTIHHWLRDGLLAGTQATLRAPWRIVLTDEVRKRLAGGEAPEGWVGLTEAARRLGTSKSRVAYWVKTGKLRAIRATVGKRRCWRIDVESTTYADQISLFDPMTNDHPKEDVV